MMIRPSESSIFLCGTDKKADCSLHRTEASSARDCRYKAEQEKVYLLLNLLLLLLLRVFVIPLVAVHILVLSVWCFLLILSLLLFVVFPSSLISFDLEIIDERF